jgi:hypothetical protein
LNFIPASKEIDTEKPRGKRKSIASANYARHRSVGNGERENCRKKRGLSQSANGRADAAHPDAAVQGERVAIKPDRAWPYRNCSFPIMPIFSTPRGKTIKTWGRA